MNTPSSEHTLPRPAYRPGVSQPCLELSLTLQCAPVAALPGVDRWLSECFEVAVPPMPELSGGPVSADEHEAAAYCWRVLHMAGLLLRAIRIPSFDPGRILRIEHRGGSDTWAMTALVPRIDNLPADWYMGTYEVAAKTVRWLVARAIELPAVQQVFERLGAFVASAQRAAPGAESTVPLLSHAWERGIPLRHLGHGIYQLGWGARQLRVDRGAVQFDSSIGSRLAHNKWLAARLLRDAGLPAPEHVAVNSLEHAMQAGRQLGWPVVVKPVDRDRGEGVSVNVRSDDVLRAAYESAAPLTKVVLVERQVTGVCHRIQVVDGKVSLVSKRMPKGVRGDGTQTVRQLVALANEEQQRKPPWTRLKPFLLDELALESLRTAGLSPDSVPAAGVLAPLRPIQTNAWGGVVDDMTQTIHPENADLAIRAARLFGLTVAGIDLISPDITRPWHENGAIVNEVNYSPLLASRANAQGMYAVLERWMQGSGRIPIVAVVGGDAALHEARGLRDERVALGLRCWLVTHDHAESPAGDARVQAVDGLFDRVIALLADPTVEALVLVVQTEEVLDAGMPVDRVDEVQEAEGSDRLSAVVALLRQACRASSPAWP